MKIITIGRSIDNQIVTPASDTTVSRHHARISFDGNRYVIEDVGSRNGTTVNGQLISGPRVLCPTDVVRVGNQPLPWLSYFSSNPNPAPYSPPSPDPDDKRNGLAIAGFVLSFLAGGVGLVLSIIGLTRSSSYGGNGRGLAIAGIIISALNILLTLIILAI